MTFFHESQLIPLAVDGERGDSCLVRTLLAAGSASKRESVVRERLDDLGFDWMGYYTASHLFDGSRFRGFMASYAPPDWSRRYFGEAYYEVDPRNLARKRWSLPLVWDGASLTDMMGRRPLDGRSKRFIEDLADSGMRSGVFQRVNCSGAKPGEDTVVSLVSSTPGRRWIDDEVLGNALTLILSLDQFWSHHVRLPTPTTEVECSVSNLVASGIPATQRAVLCHVADGLTDREIAERLGLSSHTVDYHLRQLRQRFAVHNRVQLVAAAAHLLTAA
ncbi:helix-turn-helix transcriptional regulator [Piscinibacter terrae]|uniref:helix-turn-helix transcriptional regulator n=1 Tax=Piscinibacter terrae TaxID=2496871 RepID=UPI00138662B0|nr:LuxR C-terminal-related transcriptional regulator [Albitalea terrae]